MTTERSESESSDTKQTLLILGATGDLTTRLLLPGLGALLASGGGEQLLLVGSGRFGWDDNRWRQRVADSFAAANARGARADAVIRGARYLKADVTVEDDLRRLLDACQGRVAIFFALPPAVTVQACQALAGIELPEQTRLVLEKPFATDATSAAALNDLLARLAPEDQVYRVDHYLGMSTVLNIVGLRFANRMLESVLNGEHVQSIDIVFDEALALEGRAGYYDRAGALIDMIQSHSLQVLALLAMEAPSTLEARDVRDAKAAVLRATRVWGDDPARWSRRARYTAGKIEGRALPSYVDEEGVDPDRNTETFAEVVLTIDTWRWAGVPFRVRAGKALRRLRKEAVITFKQPPWVPVGLAGYDRPDRLRIGFDPDWLRLDVNINGPGDPSVVDPMTLEAGLDPGDLPPYGQVLRGVFEGDPNLSVRGDTAVECWRIVEPVLAAWRDDQVPLQEYPAGSAVSDDWAPVQ
jgi:glucose-6-phosphate 1-dehydrogenase